MKRNQVNSIFITDAKRRSKIIIFLSIIVFVFIISLLCLIIYINKRKVQYVKYDEQSNIDYEVFIKSNEFYEKNNLEENNQYISELIDYVSANFHHKINLEKEGIEYKYSYRIEANIVVQDKVTNKNVYTFNEELVPKKEFTTKRKDVSIDEIVSIDYNKYNNLISKFVNTYNLYETKNILSVNLYVDVLGTCDEDGININESITTLEIPLTNKTVSMDVKSNLMANEDNVMLCIRPSKTNILYLITSIVGFILGIFVTIKLIIFVVNTRSAKTVYEKELKKILNNYRSYIQKINTPFVFEGYQSLKVDNFTDMLEIRDTTNQPILMFENVEKKGTHFIIPTNTKILYIYSITVKKIEKEMKAKDKINE